MSMVQTSCYQCAGPLGRLARYVAGHNLCGPKCEAAYERDEDPAGRFRVITAKDIDFDAAQADVESLN